jgi:hypothetical protein
MVAGRTVAAPFWTTRSALGGKRRGEDTLCGRKRENEKTQPEIE